MDIKKIAQQLRDKLKKYDEFIGLYLYGSRVYGTSSKSSDIDIVAVFKDGKTKNGLEVYEDVLDINIENDIVLDFHLMSEKELSLNNVFFNEIKKGLYYAR